jgi:hypothetical protein
MHISGIAGYQQKIPEHIMRDIRGELSGRRQKISPK